MIRFLLDEMFSPVIAQIARRAGVDAVSVHERRQEGAEDQNVLLTAAQDGRCVITINHKHFAPLTAHFYEENLPHAGVVLVAGHVPNNAYAAIAAALVRFAQDNPDGLQAYEIRWLNVDLAAGR